MALKNFDFKSVTEACYSQLLFYPNDEFYLFYLCESIRRNLSVRPNEGGNYFITGAYNVYEKYIPLSNQAKVSLSRKMPKINGTELSKTINYQYDFLLFGNNKELIDKLPVNSLTSNDTIEFVTNKEALDYFISRQIKLQHSSVNFVLGMIKPDTTVGVINSPNTDLNDYNEIITGLKKKVKESEVCIIPLSLDYNNEDLVFWKTANNHINQFTKVMSSLKSICRYPFIFWNLQI
ncbi:MAG: hypothetical protein IPJ32_15000 [Sphingobacteriaceae bacterium]|nr:hypothetical protein [Sphingobacteriaceae bacterium]